MIIDGPGNSQQIISTENHARIDEHFLQFESRPPHQLVCSLYVYLWPPIIHGQTCILFTNFRNFFRILGTYYASTKLGSYPFKTIFVAIILTYLKSYFDYSGTILIGNKIYQVLRSDVYGSTLACLTVCLHCTHLGILLYVIYFNNEPFGNFILVKCPVSGLCVLVIPISV